MNPTHAQFFRELRELCGKYNADISSQTAEWVKFSFDGGPDGIANYWSYRFNRYETSLQVRDLVSIPKNKKEEV